MRRRTVGLLLIIAGLLFALIPLTLIEYQSLTRYRSVETYLDRMTGEGNLDRRLSEARGHNSRLEQTGYDVVDPFSTELDEQANPLADEDGEFAHIIIPSIALSQPVYLGASYDNMAKGLAQVEGTSLPVGGEGTRSVIAGHNGWYNNHFLLFADRLEPGDRIYVVVLGKVLAYEVVDSEVILPSEGEKLAAVADRDMLTLLTCTPAPVNDKRLLVNSVRVPHEDADSTESAGSNDAREQVRRIEQNDDQAGAVRFWQYVTRLTIFVLTVTLLWAVGRLVRSSRARPTEHAAGGIENENQQS
ncbi:class C sortase [Enemella sp. A6]|uniref:class C sortase n=1 Tax=Enemella sp. A6 TaxID=3440152 RepID=UPI003EBDE805